MMRLILGKDVNVVEYQGIQINNRLNRTTDTGGCVQPALFTKKSEILENVGEFLSLSCGVHIVLCFGLLVTTQSEAVIGSKLGTFEAVMERRSLNKRSSIMDNPEQPLHHLLGRQQHTLIQHHNKPV